MHSAQNNGEDVFHYWLELKSFDWHKISLRAAECKASVLWKVNKEKVFFLFPSRMNLFSACYGPSNANLSNSLFSVELF